MTLVLGNKFFSTFNLINVRFDPENLHVNFKLEFSSRQLLKMKSNLKPLERIFIYFEKKQLLHLYVSKESMQWLQHSQDLPCVI